MKDDTQVTSKKKLGEISRDLHGCVIASYPRKSSSCCCGEEKINKLLLTNLF